MVSNWYRRKGGLRFEIEIPGNTLARIVLPVRAVAHIREGGVPLDEAVGVQVVDRTGSHIVLLAGAGRYVFSVE